MATFHVLPILEKQKVLHGKGQTAEALRAWGDFYRKLGRVYDAIDFYEKAAAGDHLREIGAEAGRQGNLFLLRRVCQAQGQEPSAGELELVAARAAVTGFEAFARAARGEPPMPAEEAPQPAVTISVVADHT